MNFSNSYLLHDAITKKNITKCKELLDKGGDPNEHKNIGTTPLMLSAHLGNLELVQLLIDYGADASIPMVDA